MSQLSLVDVLTIERSKLALLHTELKSCQESKDFQGCGITRTMIRAKTETLKSMGKAFGEVEQDIINTMVKDFAV